MDIGLMSSSRYERWTSPADLMIALGHDFDWQMDLCASSPNVCDDYFNEETNGLMQDWSMLNPCWMNPPYGRGIHHWMDKARQTTLSSSEFGCVTLVPASVGSNWWQNNVWAAKMVVNIKGRLTFGDDAYWQYLWSTEFIDGKVNKSFGQTGRRTPAPFW